MATKKTSTISTFEDPKALRDRKGLPIARIGVKPIQVVNDYEEETVKVNIMHIGHEFICELTLTKEDAKLLALGLTDAIRRFTPKLTDK